MKIKDEYDLLLKSGMFWEFYPDLTGDWEKDKSKFFKKLLILKAIRRQNENKSKISR